MKRFLISFDDTDNLQTLGTGHALDRFLNSVAHEGWYITRHQLFVNELVPYTSHNSAMCAEVSADIAMAELIELAGRFLEEESAEGSDPGLCIADRDGISEPELLVAWGLRAKREVLTKQEAYELASRCAVHLSEHGGDGQGIVGALAGVGLRLSGNDGRVRGRASAEPGRMSVRELLATTGYSRVAEVDGNILADDEVVDVVEPRVKAIYRDSEKTVPVTRAARGFRTLSKEEIKAL